MDLAISSRASARRSGSFEFSHLTSRLMMSWSRLRSIAWSSMVGNSSGHDDGSSTMDANMTARHDASGLRAHHRCNVDGCPCRMDFSRADSLLMSASGRSISMSFLRYFCMVCGGLLLLIGIGLYMKFRANLYGFSLDFLWMVLGYCWVDCRLAAAPLDCGSSPQ